MCRVSHVSGQEIGEAATGRIDRIWRWFSRSPQAEISTQLPLGADAGPSGLGLPRGLGAQRGQIDHIIILDGTLSSLYPGEESNAALTFRLLSEPLPGARRRVYYEPGLQWEGWGQLSGLAQGRGLNRQIRRAYGWLASQYRPGDRIYLFGYSRGAYGVRSLAGMIDRVGLLRNDAATERNVRAVWRHYRLAPDGTAAQAFAARHCHPLAPIEMVGVWDTVKALGLRLPLLWMLTDKYHAFHSAELGDSVKHGFHALAMNETRAVFTPVLWRCPDSRRGTVEQVWFRGAHGDIGGQIGQIASARPLANIPLVWMLERAVQCGIALPFGWRSRFPCDPHAPMVGTWRGWGKMFLLRERRQMGLDPSERIHPSVGMAEPSGLQVQLVK